MMWDMRGMAETLPPAQPVPVPMGSPWQRSTQPAPGFPVPQYYPGAPMTASSPYVPPIPSSPYAPPMQHSPYMASAPLVPPSPYMGSVPSAPSPYMGSYNYQNQPRAITPSMSHQPHAPAAYDYYSDTARDPRYVVQPHKKHRKHSTSQSPSPHSHSSNSQHRDHSSSKPRSHSHSRSTSRTRDPSDPSRSHHSRSETPSRHHHSRSETPSKHHHSRSETPSKHHHRSETPSKPHHSHSHSNSHSASPAHHHSASPSHHHSSSSKPSKHHHTYSTPSVHFAPTVPQPAPIVHSASAQSAPAYPYGHSSSQNHISYLAKVFPYSKCTGHKRAVCIGINYRGQEHELRGCVNDAHNMMKFLLRNGYKNENIFLLTDEPRSDPRQLPTRKNILGAMRWLVQDARPNDSLFLHYSGHGGQVRDQDGDEVDGWDEAIYPLDFKKAGVIIDDEMHDIMVKDLPERCRLTALFDACHSGTVLDLQYIYSAHGRLMSGGIVRKRARADVISWSACRDDQTSADTFRGGVAFGAMSHAFIEALERQPNITYQDLLKAVRHILKPKYKQKPQLGTSHHIDTTLRFIF